MPHVDEPISFGPLLRQYRIEASLTQETLAERTGLGVRSIQHLEGGSHLPHRETVSRLIKGLGLTGPERSTFEAAAQPAPRRDLLDDRPRQNLPIQLTSFVGRERELAEVTRLLETASLVTLTGTGGCGKTRLALRVAADLVDVFKEGVWLVDLAPLADPALVPQAVAAALGVHEVPGQTALATLTDSLRGRALLVVLDNCEHLLDACAQLADTLLHACPRLRLLATSRELLGISGEVAWRVPSLTLPDPGHLPPTERLSQFEAVRLFLDRARAVAPSFVLTEQSAPAVAQICWRLDGIPLALELAAARIRVLTAEQIAARLDDRFRLLTGGSRTALRRQQTLQATVDWSYALLSEPERVMLRRLAVFAGGWTLEAVEMVSVGEGIDSSDVLDLLTQLVDKSLVVAEGETEGKRYRLLETIRQYAEEKLVDAAEAEKLRDRHRDWFLQLAERANPELVGPHQVAWFDRLEIERDNLRAALTWALEHGPAELGLRLAGALWRLWHVRDYLSEGQAWMARVLTAPGAQAPTAARAAVLEGAGELSFRHDDGLAVARLAEEGLAIHRSLGDRRGAAESLRQLAVRALNEGNDVRAEELGREVLAQARDAGASWVVAQALGILASAARARGDYPLARSQHEESLAIFRELGDGRAVAGTLEALGRTAVTQGADVAARAYLRESLTIARELRSNYRINEILGLLGGLARLEGDYRQSRALLEEGLALARESGARWKIGIALFNLGSLARVEGDTRQAEILVRESLAVFHDLGVREDAAATVAFCGVLAIQHGDYRQGVYLLAAVNPRFLQRDFLLRDDRQAYEESVSAARVALGTDDFAAAWAEGRAMTLEQAVSYALDETADVSSE